MDEADNSSQLQRPGIPEPAPVAEIVPKRKTRQPSQRAQIAEQYTAALRDALEQGQALVVEFEPEDKVLTIRHRVGRAAKSLGREDVTIRRRGNTIAAYAAGE
jgi:hypothetical protein